MKLFVSCLILLKLNLRLSFPLEQPQKNLCEHLNVPVLRQAKNNSRLNLYE